MFTGNLRGFYYILRPYFIVIIIIPIMFIFKDEEREKEIAIKETHDKKEFLSLQNETTALR